MTINPAYKEEEDYGDGEPYKIAPPAAIKRTVSLANNQNLPNILQQPSDHCQSEQACKLNRKWIVAIILVLLLLAVCFIGMIACFSMISDVKAKNQELRTELSTLKKNVDDTRPKFDDSVKRNTDDDKYPSKPVLYRSCRELMNNGFNKSGKFNVAPLLNFTKTVYCDQDTFGGGWTVFLRNKYSTVTFNKNWNEYKNGFGNVDYDLWLGNEFLYKVTTLHNSHSSKTVELYVRITDLDDKIYYSKYNNFAILSEDSKYTLHVSHHSKGNMGDSLERHNNKKFTTMDSDNDNNWRNCAVYNRGYPWWFDECSYYHSILTFMYYDDNNNKYKAGPKWFHLHNNRNSLKSATMMFREKM